MTDRLRKVQLAAIFKMQITATRGPESLVSRQIQIPHTQIRLKHLKSYNCAILQNTSAIIELKLLLDLIQTIKKVYYILESASISIVLLKLDFMALKLLAQTKPPI